MYLFPMSTAVLPKCLAFFLIMICFPVAGPYYDVLLNPWECMLLENHIIGSRIYLWKYPHPHPAAKLVNKSHVNLNIFTYEIVLCNVVFC